MKGKRVIASYVYSNNLNTANNNDLSVIPPGSLIFLFMTELDSIRLILQQLNLPSFNTVIFFIILFCHYVNGEHGHETAY